MGSIWVDEFVGPALEPRWVGGHLNGSSEVSLLVRNGLHFSFAQGKQYASAGIVTRHALEGDFSAELKFDVSNPGQGCTFELAAILVAPPDTTGLPPTSFSDAHRVFNVHGAPPYISSEFDENDGWRIGWNFGNRQGGRNARGDWVADNSENRYGRSLHGPVAGAAGGRLRLSRTGGTEWQASGRNLQSDEWFPTGRKNSKLLAGPVHLRLVAKHWVKRRAGLIDAPANRIVLTSFRLVSAEN
ncbi:MAG: hypothetical protein JNJ60_22370 [Rhodocyclaceae bacterium]|nr:hypothetical protein [Rhodocyclaceae bacterium]